MAAKQCSAKEPDRNNAPRLGGRPITRPKLATRICEAWWWAETLRKICADDDMPHRSTVFRWLMKAFRIRSAAIKWRSNCMPIGG